jgi:hypothetical protein
VHCADPSATASSTCAIGPATACRCSRATASS